MNAIGKIKKIKRLKKIRIHHEGTPTLIVSAIVLLGLCTAAYFAFGLTVPFYVLVVLAGVTYAILVNFFRCPIRIFGQDTEGIVVAPADGKVVVVEEVEENEYFHDRRLMISIFMSPVNVHANWFPVDGYVTMVKHENGNFHKAFLPKASVENERSTVVIRTSDDSEILVRQIAGALARRIVTYARADEECYIDEHLGFIKFGSRVDVYLPLGTEVCVSHGQSTVGNNTVIAKLKS